jgi:hypothetical protein
MALIAAQQVTVSGITPTYAAVSASDTIDPTGGPKILHVKNGGASPDVVTLVVPGTLYGVAIADVTVSVTNAQERMILVPSELVDPASGVITVLHGFITSVTQGLFRL